jgi:hypothetical protein
VPGKDQRPAGEHEEEEFFRKLFSSFLWLFFGLWLVVSTQMVEAKKIVFSEKRFLESSV